MQTNSKQKFEIVFRFLMLFNYLRYLKCFITYQSF